MTIRYSVIEIFTREGTRCQSRLLYEDVLEYIRGLNIAARCMVTRGSEACYEDGEIATQGIMDLSLPINAKCVKISDAGKFLGGYQNVI